MRCDYITEMSVLTTWGCFTDSFYIVVNADYKVMQHAGAK